MSEITNPSAEHYDVVIIGAGISGIGAACHLGRLCPGKRYIILEGRADLGGTWDFFRYPGVRSDSDMYTLGYAFHPWTNPKAIADGASILGYLREVAERYGVDQHIRFRHKVLRANWSALDARWTVEAQTGDAETPVHFTCNFLFMCSGYYNYADAYMPDFPKRGDFTGPVIHPQNWPSTIDYAHKNIVVIGSGATAITLVPELAKQARHVTMLQRSPSYVMSAPAVDTIAGFLNRYLPSKLAYGISRWRHVLENQFFYTLCKVQPKLAKKYLFGKLFKELGPDFDYQTHFTPRYNPWEQRLCLVPDSDFFKALKSARASIVTDTISHFTATGIQLKSGAHLAADIIVSATGLNLLSLGGVNLSVDGAPVNVPDKVVYKGMMFNDVPNLAFVAGYLNASWTLRSDLTGDYFCRLLNHMDKAGKNICAPRLQDTTMPIKDLVDFSSGYFERAKPMMPKQGGTSPWKKSQNYPADLIALKFGAVNDGVMVFGRTDPTSRYEPL
jgi:monooxygenase